MKYLGFLPKEIPDGHSRLGYYFKAGVSKVIGSPAKMFETTK